MDAENANSVISQAHHFPHSMRELDVFDIRMYAALAFCLVVFYLFGTVLLGRLKNPFASVGVKLAIGSLCFISLMAVIHSGIRTGMLFYLFFFTVMAVKNRAKPDFSDLKELGIAKILLVIMCFVIFFTEEGWRSDLLVNEEVYVGNADVSYYGSFAHEMYRTGWETSPENQTPEMRGLIYHFGDLWFSGFFSNYFKILPYYSYNVLFRSFAIGTIVLMIFGWCSQLSQRILPIIAISVFSVLATYMELFRHGTDQIALLQMFSCIYAAYGLGSHLIIMLAATAFSIYLIEKNWLLGAAGLLLSPFLNAGLLTVPVVSMSLLLALLVILKKFRIDLAHMERKDGIFLFIISTIPLFYYVLDDRMFSSQGGSIISVEFFYLFVHTTIRVLLSQVMVVPFLVGLLYFLRSKEMAYQRLALVHTVFYLGTLISFGLIFPQIQGNSIQILSMHFQGFLVPVCTVGLWGLIQVKDQRFLRNVSILLLVAVMTQGFRVFISSKGQRSTFDWEWHMPGYANTHKLKLEEWKKMRALLNEETTSIGYFVCDLKSGAGTDYSEFTYLKAILPGAIFFRMSPLPGDTMLSREMLEAYCRNSLGYFAKKNRFRKQDTEEELMEFLRPNYLMLPNDTLRYCIPRQWLKESQEIISTGSYTFFRKQY